MTKKDNKDKVVKQLVVSKYADGSFSFHFKNDKYFDDTDLAYIAQVMKYEVDNDIKSDNLKH